MRNKNIINNLEEKEIKIFEKNIKYNRLECVDPWDFFNALPLNYQEHFLQNKFFLKKYPWSENIFFSSDAEKYSLFDNYIYENDFNFINKDCHELLFVGKIERDFRIYQKMRVRLLEIYSDFDLQNDKFKEKNEIKEIVEEIDFILRINYLGENNIFKGSLERLYDNFFFKTSFFSKRKNFIKLLELKEIILKIFEDHRYSRENYVNIGREKEIKKLKLKISEFEKELQRRDMKETFENKIKW